jgi:hypothetical protein
MERNWQGMASAATKSAPSADDPLVIVACSSCPYFRETPQPQNETSRGTCLREPFGIAKMATEWCGEHPALVMRRFKTLAPLFASALADAIVARTAVRR